MNIKHELITANLEGKCPPQNWTHRAIDEIDKLEKIVASLCETAETNRRLNYLLDQINILSERK